MNNNTGVIVIGGTIIALFAGGAEAGHRMDVFIVIFALFLIFFTPVFVANARHHRNATAILVLTILLGWSGIAWVGAPLRAFTDNRKVNQS